MKVIRYTFYGLFLSMLIFLILGELLLPVEGGARMESSPYFNSGWKRVNPDGRKEPIVIPGECDAKPGETVRIEARLPYFLPKDATLCFQGSLQDITVFIDGKLVRHYSTDTTRPYGKDSASAFVFVGLESEHAAKEVVVDLVSDSLYSGRLNQIYFGSELGIWMQILQENGVIFLIALCLLLLSMAAIVISALLRMFYKTEFAIGQLGWVSLLSALWVISESQLRQLIFQNVTVISTVSYLCVMLIPYPFILYINNIQAKRYQKWYLILLTLTTVNNLACIVLQLFNIVDFIANMPYMVLMIILAVVLASITTVRDWYTRQVESYRLVAIGSIGPVIGGFVSIYLSSRIGGDNYVGLALSCGLLFFLSMAFIVAGKSVVQTEKERQKAIEASDSKTSFLARMSHEIRTPINTILGMNEMMQRENKDSAIAEYISYSQSAGRMLLALVNDVLDYSKIDSGVITISDNPYVLTEILGDSVHMLEARAKKKGLKVELKVDEELPSRLSGDEIALKQILTNLLTNAVKYTEKGSITLGVKSNYADDGNFYLKITVADTGDGIREEDIDKLFHSFSRLDIKKNRDVEGTGLGLAIVKQLVDKMGGDIAVRSVYGEGSLFEVTIPQRIVQAKPIGNIMEAFEKEVQEQNQFYTNFVAPKAKILVVDDNEMNLVVIKGLLKQTKIQIDTAINGADALLQCRSKRYDLIFMDHMMPSMDGTETLHLIRLEAGNQNVDTPVVVLTANAVAGCKEEYLKAGFVDYIAKPIEMLKLERILRTHLNPFLIENREEEPKLPTTKHAEPEAAGKRIDRSLGLQYCYEETVYEEALRAYLAQGRDYQKQLPKLLEEQDWDKLSIITHAIKSSSLSIGAEKLSSLAKEEEKLAREKEETLFTERFSKFFTEFGMVLDEIEQGNTMDKSGSPA